MKMVKKIGLFLLSVVLFFSNSRQALAANDSVEYFKTVCGSDFAYGGVGGLFLKGNGQINLTRPLNGGTIVIKEAYLYWHGSIVNAATSQQVRTATLNGTVLTGSNLGFSGPNGWDEDPILRGFSQAWVADATAVVQAAAANNNGNGPYLISFPSQNVSGASLVIFYDDGNTANNRDYILFHGNDSNSGEFGQVGWGVGIGGFDYIAGSTVGLQLHVSDGQSYHEAPLLLNNQPLHHGDPLHVFEGGDSISREDNHTGNASFAALGISYPDTVLWDIKNFDITSYVSTPGPVLFGLTTAVTQDYYSLLLAIVDVPAGGGQQCGGAPPAPNSPPVVTCLSPPTSAEANAQGNPVNVTATFNAQVTDADGLRPLVVQWYVGDTLEHTTTFPAEGHAMSKSVSFTRVFNFPRNETHTIKVVAGDGLTQDFCTTTITVLEPVPPVVDCGLPTVVTANLLGFAQTPDMTPKMNSGALDQIIVTDNQPSNFAFELAQLPFAGSSINIGTHQVTVVVKDEAGNSSQCLKTLVVVPAGGILPPTINCLGPITILAGLDNTGIVPNVLGLVTVADAITPLNLLEVTQTPAAGTHLPPGTHNIQVTVRNLGLLTATCSKVLNILDNPPVAVDDTASTTEDTPVDILISDLLVNDSDPDQGDSITLISVQDATHGTVSMDAQTGIVTFTPEDGFNGQALFTYIIRDQSGNTATGTVRVTVIPGTDPPVAQDDSASTTEDTAVTITVLGNDSDPDNDPLTIVSTSSPGNGTVSIVGNTLVYTPNPDFNGIDTFTYTISDGTGGTATATVNITVAPSNDPPVAQDDEASTQEDSPVTISVLDNDSDPDGDDLTVASASAPANGTVSIVGGQIIYTPNPDFHGEDEFTYTISDGHGGASTATVRVTIGDANDPPTAHNDSAVTDSGNGVDISVLDNDTDPENDLLEVIDTTQGANGSVVNFGTHVNYFPNDGFFGTDTFEYTISDGNGGTSTAIVTVTVLEVNRPPEAQDDAEATNENTPVTIDVLGNDSDPENDPLSISEVSQPDNGTVQVIDGQIVYTPNPGFSGTETLIYIVSDGRGGFAEATITIDVISVPDAPVAVDDEAETNEDTPVTITVLDNDYDLDGDELNLISTTNPAHGTVEIVDGEIVYAPDANFSGEDTFTYTIDDGTGLTATATVTVIVLPINDPPVGVADAATTPRNTPVTISVLGNDSDPDGDILTITGASNPAHGTVTINANGTITYTPATGYTGSDSFTYTISDGKGGTTTVTVTVNVVSVNTPPDARADFDTTTPGAAVIVSVLSNDTDPDGDMLTIVSATPPGHGTAVVNANGTISYTPANGFTGTDSFTYTISDGKGGTDTATVTIEVTDGCSLYPIALHVSSLSGKQPGATISDVYNGANPGNFGWLTWAGSPSVPTLVASLTPPGNSYTYIDPSDSSDHVVSVGDWVQGSPGVSNSSSVRNALNVLKSMDITIPVWDSVRASGNNTDYHVVAFARIRILSYSLPNQNRITAKFLGFVNCSVENQPPVADAGEDKTITMPGSVSLNGSVTDDGMPNGTLTAQWTKVSGPGNVTFSNASAAVTTATFSVDGTYVLRLTANDSALTDDDTMKVTVKPSNRPPDANNDSKSTNEDSPLTINVKWNDSDPDDDTITVTAVTQGAHGTVSINSDGTVKYIPAANYNGTDTFTYTISDGKGGTDTATVTITICAVNDSPVAVNDSGTTPKNTSINSIPVLNNDSDPDGDTLSIKTYQSTTSKGGTVSKNSNGTLKYTPKYNFVGTDTFTYTVQDGKGGYATATVTIVVTQVNRPPVACDDSKTTNEDSPVKVYILNNDSDPDDDALSITGVTQGAHGTVVVNSDKTVTYTPAANFSGTDSFTYTITDGKGETDTAKVTITICPVNDAPNAVNDAVTTPRNTAITSIVVLGNDTDIDGGSLVVTSVQSTSAQGGTVSKNSNGTIKYTPKYNFVGTDTFTYTISDGKGGTDTATVTVTVTNVNRPPTAKDDSKSTDEDKPVTITVLANDSDPDGDSISVISVTNPGHGEVEINSNGTITYDPDNNYVGSDSFNYTISDGKGGTDTGKVVITICAVNDPPNAVNDSATTSKNVRINSIRVTANDTDPEGDSLSVSSYQTTSKNGGTVSKNSDGTLKYTPKYNFVGTDTFTYTITDGKGGYDTATVTIVIGSANGAPVADNDCITGYKNTKITTDNLLCNDEDPNGDSLTVISFTATSSQGGTVSYLGNGRFSYTPRYNFTGTDTFTYTISDGKGGTDTATVTVNVRYCNDRDYDYDYNPDRYNSNCRPRVSASFSGKYVTACSTKDLSNCVIQFTDGSRQKFDGLSGYSKTLCGTGSNSGKKIKGVWIKSGNNASGDGPGYGEYVGCN